MLLQKFMFLSRFGTNLKNMQHFPAIAIAKSKLQTYDRESLLRTVRLLNLFLYKLVPHAILRPYVAVLIFPGS